MFDTMLDKKQVMGILNVTPDSFSDGGRYVDPAQAVEHARLLIQEEADILDIGGQSTRPGYVEVSAEEEIARVIPVIKEIRRFSAIPISVDTYFPKVAAAAFEAGASIINDVRGLDTPGMKELVHQYQPPVIIMHSRKRKREWTAAQDIQRFYEEKLEECEKLGLTREKICFDPGVGFGKTTEENIEMIRTPKAFIMPGIASLYGVSRKRVIGHLTGENEPANRDYGTISASLCVLEKGVDIVRVHNVKGMKDALKVWETCH